MFDQIRQTSQFLHQALDGLTQRQQAISNNLANADTPRFKATDVIFETHMQAQLDTLKSGANEPINPSSLHVTHTGHMNVELPEDGPLVLQNLDTRMRNDGNNVDLDLEMTRMAQANLNYSAVSQMLEGRFSSLKYIISEGGR